jgi:hypothetical protein
MHPAKQQRICESVNITAVEVGSNSYRISRPGSTSLLPFASGNLSALRPRDCASALVVLSIAQAASGSRPFCRTVARRRSVCTEAKDGRSIKFASRRQRKEFLAICMVSGQTQDLGRKKSNADYILAKADSFPHVGRPSTECLMLMLPEAGQVE